MRAPGPARLPDGPLAGFSFQQVGRPSARSLGFSLCLHGIAIVSMGFISINAPPDMRSPARTVRDATTIKIGDRVYFVTRIPILPQARKPAESQKASPQPERKASAVKPPPKPEPIETTAAEIAAAEAASSSTPAPRVFVPPQVKENFISDATLIQPLSPPDQIPIVVPLPSFRIWTAPLLPPDQPKPVLAPGGRTTAEATPPPQPSTDLELIHANPVPSDTKAKLVLPPTPPPILDPKAVRVYPPDALSQFKVGDPISVLSLSDRPVPPSEKLVIPPGNVLGKSGEEKGTGLSAIKGTSPIPDSRSSAKDASTAGAGLANGAPGSRVILRPPNGTFDAMVIQSSPVDQFPEAKDLLTGRPIYTVYISVGSAKDWALYFCVPGENRDTGGETRIVHLGGGTPMQAPYPTRIERPDVARPTYEKYILVHGFVTANGRFEDLRVVRPVTAETDKAVIASLAGWEFRSATRDGVKVAVEFLLSIPVAGL